MREGGIPYIILPDKDTVPGRAGEVARPLHLPVVLALAAIQLHADPHAGREVSRANPPIDFDPVAV